MDWRWREQHWRGVLVLWHETLRGVIQINRTDVFAPAGGHSLLRWVPAICQVKGWKMIAMHVKDAT